MAGKPLSPEIIEETKRAMLATNGNKTEAARMVGVSRSTFANRWLRVQAMKEDDSPLEIMPIPDEVDREELIARRKKEYDRVEARETALALVGCRVRLDGPIGILFHGDPHVDDPGTDIAEIERNSRYTRDIEGLFAASVGDMTNNWIGRLARIYAEQTTTQNEAFVLGEWFVELNEWLFLVGGNHEAWSGAGDPFKFICRQRSALYQSSEVRMQLRFPHGEPVTVNCRHDFQGHSMWNPVHGAGKAAQLGPMDHIFVNGHRHVSGYMPIMQPNGTLSHCIQVGSYKRFDRYAKEKGFRDQQISPAVVCIINPVAERETDKVQVFHDVERAVDYLQYLRKQA